MNGKKSLYALHYTKNLLEACMNWVESEFKNMDLGDRRLNNRVIKITETLGLAPGRTIPQAFTTRADMKACYNFFGNDVVTEELLLVPHIERTIERIKEYDTVLLLTDTSEANYSTKTAMKDKERLSQTNTGLWLHPTFAVTPDRLPLGIIDNNFWHREPEVFKGKKSERDKQPIEEKESYRWIASYLKACEVAKETPETQIIHICDRDADMIELFEIASQKAKQGEPYANFIVRSQYDRSIEKEESEKDSENDNINKKLWRSLRNSPTLGKLEFTVSPTDERKGRKVEMEIKGVSVTLKRACKNIKVKVNAVMTIEIDPPEGETPIGWILITDLPIETFDDVKNVIKYYLCRWQIELFFKVLKSGCKIEERQLQAAYRMENLITIFMILAWRVMFTMMLGRVCPDISAGDIFEAAEWKAVYKIQNKNKPLPRKPPRLGDFIIMIAALGGYIPTKKGAPPGVKVMWKGMSRMIDFAIAWDAFGG